MKNKYKLLIAISGILLIYACQFSSDMNERHHNYGDTNNVDTIYNPIIHLDTIK